MAARRLTPKARASWRRLLMRLVAIAEADPAQAAAVRKVVAGMEATRKAKPRRRGVA